MLRWLLPATLIFLSACTENPATALGQLERDRIAHTATVNEIIIKLPVAQGHAVKQGTVLVQLDNRLQQALVDEARANVARAEAQLEKLRNGARVEEVAAAQARVAAHRATLIESEKAYQRTKKLYTRKLDSLTNLDQSKARRDTASANLQNAREQLRELTNGTREEDLRIATAELTAAESRVAIELKRLHDLTITATRDGILDSLPWNLGERVTAGSPVAIVLAGSAPYARVYIPEPYRVKINGGTTLSVSIDGLSQPVVGHVRWIASEPAFTPYYALNQQERSRLVYLAEIQLPDSASHLPSGIPVSVSLP